MADPDKQDQKVVGPEEEGSSGGEEEGLLEGMSVLDFDMLCSTVAMQNQGKWRLLETDDEEIGGGGEFGGVFRLWEGDLLDCFEDRRIAIESLCCPCSRFGKNMKRAGFGSSFLQGALYLMLVLLAVVNCFAFTVTRRYQFLYLGLALIVSVGIYLGYLRTRIRKKFNIQAGDTYLDDCVYHLICPYCSMCQEARTLEMNNVQDGFWHGMSSDALGFIRDFAIGGASGAVAKTLTAPIERVKLLIQTQDANPRIRSGEIPRYTGIVNCFSRVASEQGIAAFWRGNFTNVIRYFPTQAFNFAFKDSIKKLFPKFSPKDEFGKFFLVQLASGGLAGAGSLCIVYPLDYARTRLASDVGKERVFNGLADCLVKTAKGPAGIMGLYNGFGVSVAGIIPYRGVYFGLYDSLREKNPYKSDYGVMGIVSKFAVAQTTAIAAGYASYPFDTVRRRLQMQSEKPKDQWLYKGTADCFTKILKEEGTQAMFKGAGANALRTVGSALVLVLYDQLQGILGVNIGAGSGE